MDQKAVFAFYRSYVLIGAKIVTLCLGHMVCASQPPPALVAGNVAGTGRR